MWVREQDGRQHRGRLAAREAESFVLELRERVTIRYEQVAALRQIQPDRAARRRAIRLLIGVGGCIVFVLVAAIELRKS